MVATSRRMLEQLQIPAPHRTRARAQAEGGAWQHGRVAVDRETCQAVWRAPAGFRGPRLQPRLLHRQGPAADSADGGIFQRPAQTNFAAQDTAAKQAKLQEYVTTGAGLCVKVQRLRPQLHPNSERPWVQSRRGGVRAHPGRRRRVWRLAGHATSSYPHPPAAEGRCETAAGELPVRTNTPRAGRRFCVKWEAQKVVVVWDLARYSIL
jgi:hypothetical protein